MPGMPGTTASPPALPMTDRSNTWTFTQVFKANPPFTIPAGASSGSVLTSDSAGNATWGALPAFPAIITSPAGGGVSTSVSATAVTTSFPQTTATQLADTTRDYMVYLTMTGGGSAKTLSLSMGPSTGQENTVFDLVSTPGQSVPVTVRLPAAWYVYWDGTASLTTSTIAVSC